MPKICFGFQFIPKGFKKNYSENIQNNCPIIKSTLKSEDRFIIGQ
jgi:hypothetical protein